MKLYIYSRETIVQRRNYLCRKDNTDNIQTSLTLKLFFKAVQGKVRTFLYLSSPIYYISTILSWACVIWTYIGKNFSNAMYPSLLLLSFHDVLPHTSENYAKN